MTIIFHMTITTTSIFCLFSCEGFSFSFAIDYLNLLLICELEINEKKFNPYHTGLDDNHSD